LLSLLGCAPAQPEGGLSQLHEPAQLAAPGNSYLGLGRRYLVAGDVSLAKEAFIRSLRVEGMSAAALTGLGIAAEREGLLTEARRFFERARDVDPDSVLARNNLGAVLYRLGAYIEARRAFQAALTLSGGTNRVAAHNLGLTDLALHELDRNHVPIGANPYPLQREGSAEYRLLAEGE